MSVAIPRSQIIRLDFDLDAAVALFVEMLAEHKLSRNTPSPTAHPIVDYIVRNGGGSYTVDEDIPAQILDVFTKLKTGNNVTARYADFTRTRIIVALDGNDVTGFQSAIDLQQITTRAGAINPPNYQSAAWQDVESTMLTVTIDGSAKPVPQGMIATVLADLSAANIAVAAYVPPPVPVPTSITRRQLLIAATQAGFISAAHALAAAQTGAIPPEISSVFAGLPPNQNIAAQITWAAVTNIYRTDPLTLAVAAALGLSSDQIDEFFRAASAL